LLIIEDGKIFDGNIENKASILFKHKLAPKFTYN